MTEQKPALFTVEVQLRDIIALIQDADSVVWTQFRADHDLPADAALVHAWITTNLETPDVLKLRFCSPSGRLGPRLVTPTRRWPNPTERVHPVTPPELCPQPDPNASPLDFIRGLL